MMKLCCAIPMKRLTIYFFVVISLVDIDKDKIIFHIFIISDRKVKYLTEPYYFQESDRFGSL
jgi:hypothetical protein